MATIIERDVHHGAGDAGDSSAATLIVTIVALAVIVGLALFFFRAYPFNGATPATDNGINVDVDLPTPTPTPDGTAQ